MKILQSQGFKAQDPVSQIKQLLQQAQQLAHHIEDNRLAGPLQEALQNALQAASSPQPRGPGMLPRT